jgi:hypothetical protein
MNSNADKITCVVCGVRAEEITDPLIREAYGENFEWGVR